MDDFKIILYILAAVAYFLFTQWRKAFKTPDEDELPAPRNQKGATDYPSKPSTSFEDILRELQPKAEKGRAIVEAAKEKVQENIPPLAPVMPAEIKYKSYEDKAPRALSWEKTAEALEAAKRSGKRNKPVFEAYEKEVRLQRTSHYAKLLRNPTTVRDAIILTEILNRKYN
ncbi:hypothetical protein ACSX1A_07470 [Pontibacter sp. MBLB2868]|uniref:hypothetical protein n=1 Tax=Pontibacter sp. MBLB2868 TaxID=3451555 RepID=UPI003F754EB7